MIDQDAVVVLPASTQFRYFAIHAPRYHDKRVLLKASKVGEHNKVVFLSAPSLGGDPYYVSGKAVRKYPKQSNSKIDCYAVPLEELKKLVLNERDPLLIW